MAHGTAIPRITYKQIQEAHLAAIQSAVSCEMSCEAIGCPILWTAVLAEQVTVDTILRTKSGRVGVRAGGCSGACGVTPVTCDPN